MVQCASKQYKHPKMSFDKMDIEGDLGEFIKNYKPFDHITSFTCLHWVQNQDQAIENMYYLLNDNGDCLFTLLGTNATFQTYTRLSQHDRWAKYMKDVDRYISPYCYALNPVEELRSILYRKGFTMCNVELRDKDHDYESLERLKTGMRVVNPFVERIPSNEQDAFMDDVIDGIRKIQLAIDEKETRVLISYKILVAYARK